MTENKPIRIAQIMGKWVGGGVEAVVMNYYRYIDRNKIQFDFICDEDSTNIPYEEIEKLGGKVILIPPYQKVFKYHKELKRVLKEGKYRIVHSHINTLSVFSLFAAKCAGVHIRIAHSHSTTNKKEWKKNFLKIILRPFIKFFATDFMACTEHAAKWMFGKNEDFFLLTNAIDVDKFTFNEEKRKKIRKELKISNDTVVIGHVGRFVKQKNHEFLIDVYNEFYKKNENSRLLLIGQGPLEKKIKDKIKKLKIEKNVIFLGQREDVKDLYNIMDIFVFPSLYEGLGMVVVEAQCNNLWCIVSNEIPKVADFTGKVKFLDIKSKKNIWCDEIAKWLKYSRNFKKINSEKYDINYESKKLENYYIEKNKIKICHFVSGLKSGGVESMIYNYCSKIEQNMYKFCLVYQHEPSQKNVQEFKNINFELFRIASKVKHPLKNYYESKKYLKKNNFDVVHCHMTIMNFIPLIAAKKLKIKTRICHSHNNDNRKKNIIIILIEKILKIINIKCATHLIACGNDAGKYMFTDNNYTIIKNALDLSKFKYNEQFRKKIRNQYNIKLDDILIGHIGRFTIQKNHRFIISLAERLVYDNPHIKFLLVGDGENKKIIEDLVVEKKLKDNVIFSGIIDNTNEYYSAFDCFILPSIWEGLPVVGIEAQVSGLRCLFSENIDKNVKINNNVDFLCIDSVNIWNYNIQKIKKYDRKIETTRFINEGLDIDYEVNKLIAIYNGGVK